MPEAYLHKWVLFNKLVRNSTVCMKENVQKTFQNSPNHLYKSRLFQKFQCLVFLQCTFINAGSRCMWSIYFSLIILYQLWKLKVGFETFNHDTMLVQCGMNFDIVFTEVEWRLISAILKLITKPPLRSVIMWNQLSCWSCATIPWVFYKRFGIVQIAYTITYKLAFSPDWKRY